MHEESHEGHSHDPRPALSMGGGQLPVPGSTKATTSFKVALDIWIRRFKEAQGHIRALEAENDKLSARLAEVMEMMTDEQLEELRSRWLGDGDA